MGWTDTLFQEAKNMWVAGASAKIISDAISTPDNPITRNAVIGKLTRTGVMGDGGTHQKRPVKVRSPYTMPKVRRSRDKNAQTPTRRYGQNSPVKEPTPLPVEKPATETAILWLKMGYGHCRWPLNDPNPIERHRVCGATTLDAKSYCTFHAQAAVGPRTRGERSAVPASL